MNGLGNRKIKILLGMGMLFLLMIGCVGELGVSNQSMMETQSAMSVQLTVSALELQKQQEASKAEENDAVNAQATAAFMLAVQGTTQAQQAAMEAQQATQQALQEASQQNVQEEASQAGPPSQPTSSQPASSQAMSFDEWKKKARILLYEDMAGVFRADRIILSALNTLGLKPSTDEKDAAGRFLMDLKAGGPGGEPWDLIISASEARTGVQGEFIPVLIDNVNRGSSLIMEHWNIDGISQGKITTLLMMCGVEYERDIAVQPTACTLPENENFLVLWPQDQENPLLHQPNEGIRVSSMSQFWSEWYSAACASGLWPFPYDYGDELRLLPNSSSKVILTTHSTSTDHHAALVSCQDERIIFWTSSTHNYAYNRVLPLWQNMIHNALKARYNMVTQQAAK